MANLDVERGVDKVMAIQRNEPNRHKLLVFNGD